MNVNIHILFEKHINVRFYSFKSNKEISVINIFVNSSNLVLYSNSYVVKSDVLKWGSDEKQQIVINLPVVDNSSLTKQSLILTKLIS